MKLYSTEQMRAWDRVTIEKKFDNSSELMEIAVKTCTDFLLDDQFARRYIIVCGTGNNGGDGLCIARFMSEEGQPVTVYIAGDSETGSEDFKKNLQMLLNTEVSIHFLSEKDYTFQAEYDDIIVDCLFGTGISRPIEGWLINLIAHINSLTNRTVSIDLPSGLLPDLIGIQTGAIVSADLTLTFQIPKCAMLFPENFQYVGEFEILNIGLDKEFESNEDSLLHYFVKYDAAQIYQPRLKFQHKNSFGHVGIIAGSKGKMGAAILCSLAAMRAGAGLVTAQIPSSGESVLQGAVPEVMTQADEGEYYLTKAELSEKNDATAIGPGIGQSPETAIMLRKILRGKHDHPLVLDADALNLVASKKMLSSLPAGTILTPHIGEFDRLFGKHENNFQRFETLREKAHEYNCVIVLKGAHTMVASPDDGLLSFNSSGNAGMATAGSGDVLTGVIVALCAQGYNPADAARLGVYLHGAAGDIAALGGHSSGLIARDIIECLPDAIDEIETIRRMLR